MEILDPLEWKKNPDGTWNNYLDCEGRTWRVWNPLEDDGDALRLAVKLRMLVDVGINNMTGVEAQAHGSNCLCVERGFDPYIVRRAIVRAAAEIGKSK